MGDCLRLYGNRWGIANYHLHSKICLQPLLEEFLSEHIFRCASLSFIRFSKFGDDAEVFKRRGVAFDLSMGRELTQEAAHDLP
jgi:hypothetical protein